jgi:enoyl-CoA hydratase/carnithine racemase
MGMSVARISVSATELRAADGDAVLVTAEGLRYSDEVAAFLRRLASVPLPTVAVVSGQCDASALAVLAAVSLGFVTDDVAVSVDAETALALGLTSSLPAALGGARARGLLFAESVDAATLRVCGLAQHGNPEEAVRHLAQPSAALLVRSLRVAARSTPDQARLYDAELLA